MLNVIEDDTTTSDQKATSVTINLPVDPFSRDGGRWLQLARDTIQRLQEDPRILGGVEVFIEGSGADFHDKQQDMAQKINFQLGVFVAIAFLELSFLLGGFLMSLKLLVALGMAIAISLGVVALVPMSSWFGLSRLEVFEGPLELPTVYLLTGAVLVLGHFASQQGKGRKSIDSSSAFVSLSMTLWGGCFLSSLWPIVFVSSLLVHHFWMQSLVVPVVNSILGDEQTDMLAFKQRNDDRIQDMQHQAYLAKFDTFLLSPDAP